MENNSCFKTAGTPIYVAPEIFDLAIAQQENKSTESLVGLSPASDIWALGICFYSILVNIDVWPGGLRDIDIEEINQVIKTTQLSFNTDNIALNSLLNSMLKIDPQKRLSAGDLLDLYQNDLAMI